VPRNLQVAADLHIVPTAGCRNVQHGAYCPAVAEQALDALVVGSHGELPVILLVILALALHRADLIAACDAGRVLRVGRGRDFAAAADLERAGRGAVLLRHWLFGRQAFQLVIHQPDLCRFQGCG